MEQKFCCDQCTWNCNNNVIGSREQEYIPVGCVPAASKVISGDGVAASGPGGCLPLAPRGFPMETPQADTPCPFHAGIHTHHAHWICHTPSPWTDRHL